MNKLFSFLSIIFISIVAIGCSCDREKDRNDVVLIDKGEKAKTTIVSPGESKFRIGEAIPFSIAKKDAAAVIDSVQFFLDDEHQGTSRAVPYKYIMATEGKKVGAHLLRAVVYYAEGTSDVNRKSITLLSDIEPARYTYRIVRKFPHDPQAFTQGLVFDGNYLYEGTGQKGASSLRKVELVTGKVIKIHYLSSNIFGEGITLFQDKIIQLSWKARTGFVYEKDSFKELKQFNYTTEGWGITTLENELVMSDGTATLYKLNPLSFEVKDRLEVYNQFGPIVDLNELEYIDGIIYANVYQTDEIIMIDPDNGKVTGIIDMSGLVNFNEKSAQVDVLNGIAYHRANDHLLVTGKWWPNIYEVALIEEQPAIALTASDDVDS